VEAAVTAYLLLAGRYENARLWNVGWGDGTTMTNVDGRKSGLVTWYSVFLMNNKTTYGSDGNKRKKKAALFKMENNQYRIIGFMKINYRKRLSGQINIEQVLQPGQINC
jgi:hypothetical protein